SPLALPRVVGNAEQQCIALHGDYPGDPMGARPHRPSELGRAGGWTHATRLHPAKIRPMEAEASRTSPCRLAFSSYRLQSRAIAPIRTRWTRSISLSASARILCFVCRE